MKFKLLIVVVLSCFITISDSALSQAQEKTIKYKIKKLGLRVGKASLTFNGERQIDGKKAVLVTFKAKAFNFLDLEEVYLDPETLYPVRIDRTLNFWGKKEKIIEYYDQAKGEVRFVTLEPEAKEEVKQQTPLIDNVYAFIYRYHKGLIDIQQNQLRLHLHTYDFDLNLKQEKFLKAAGKKYTVRHFVSDPKKIELYLDTGPEKLPVRIDGATGIGKTHMIMYKIQ